jgi:hypothetical protein
MAGTCRMHGAKTKSEGKKDPDVDGSKVVPVRHEDVWGSGCIDPRFLDLGISFR